MAYLLFKNIETQEISQYEEISYYIAHSWSLEIGKRQRENKRKNKFTGFNSFSSH